ncbi:unnamed protein product [Closterium sp. NIES-65]|nr:unnamed protein product [Closterium sp. NIES-65]
MVISTYQVKRMVVSTYQAASGAGAAAMAELELQTKEVSAWGKGSWGWGKWDRQAGIGWAVIGGRDTGKEKGDQVLDDGKTTTTMPFPRAIAPCPHTTLHHTPPSVRCPVPAVCLSYAFNLFSHNSPMTANGYNEEEMKMVKETRKIWSDPSVAVAATLIIRVPVLPAVSLKRSDPSVAVTATCIRVPVMRAHAESINLTLEEPLSESHLAGVMRAHAESINLTLEEPLSEVEAKEILSGAEGLYLIDDRDTNTFPTPLDAAPLCFPIPSPCPPHSCCPSVFSYSPSPRAARQVSNKDDVAVGRIRQDISQPDNKGLDLFVCGDQIRKGAALNAVQIAELLVKKAGAA